MESSQTTAKAINDLLQLPQQDQHALLEVIEDYFGDWQEDSSTCIDDSYDAITCSDDEQTGKLQTQLVSND